MYHDKRRTRNGDNDGDDESDNQASAGLLSHVAHTAESCRGELEEMANGQTDSEERDGRGGMR